MEECLARRVALLLLAVGWALLRWTSRNEERDRDGERERTKRGKERERERESERESERAGDRERWHKFYVDTRQRTTRRTLDARIVHVSHRVSRYFCAPDCFVRILLSRFFRIEVSRPEIVRVPFTSCRACIRDLEEP